MEDLEGLLVGAGIVLLVSRFVFRMLVDRL